MAMVNIPSTCDDPQYRYKMPRLISKKEGRGNGSKTSICNMADVARALKRPPQYTTKWFGAELGAQSTYTNKEGEGERAIVNGHHDTPIFQTMLDKFIEKYVLCENCHLPEIDMNVKRGTIIAKCAACGWAGDLDNNHKIAAFVSKNPPDQSGLGIVNLAVEGSKDMKSKEEKRKEREEKRKAKADGGDGEDGAEEEDDEAKEKRRAERRAKKEASGEKKEKKERSGDKKERSGEKKSSSKKEEKPAESEDSGDAKGGDDEDDVLYDSEIVKEVIKVMKEFIESKNKSGKVKPDDIFEELRMHQLRIGVKLFDHKIRFYVALESLMPSGAMDAKEITEHKQVLDKILESPKIPASDVLWGFDAYLSQNEKSVRSYPMVLKVIYDEEWATEEELTKYYTDDEGAGEPGFEAAKKSGEPFLKWLATAEASDDDDEDEDSDAS